MWESTLLSEVVVSHDYFVVRNYLEVSYQLWELG
jgi:hypothetical protein